VCYNVSFFFIEGFDQTLRSPWIWYRHGTLSSGLEENEQQRVDFDRLEQVNSHFSHFGNTKIKKSVCFRQPSILSNGKQIMIKQSRHDAIKNNHHVFETPTPWLFLTSFG